MGKKVSTKFNLVPCNTKYFVIYYYQQKSTSGQFPQISFTYMFQKKGRAMNIQLKKGVMEIVVLSMLRRKDYYGYELVTDISRYIEMSEGTIYPLLNRFKKDGLVATYLAESHNGPPRKYYRITDTGREEFTESLKEWTEFNKAVKKILAEGGDLHE